MEPFLFRSYYYCVKGLATDLIELESEMRRLNSVDQGCVQWHLLNGHISTWLRYIGEKNLANRLSSSNSTEDAIRIVARTTSRRKSTSSKKTAAGKRSGKT
ncbi:hypothetical protein IX51_05070 [uncultured archaeon]|nr:hypothetical protein IX51_05070 [uncultured archaeon]HKJ96907.1 hypothetical protein [Thermoplasmataceae archaeon]